MSGSARLNMPFLSPGQAQKELFHNEAVQTLDLLAAAAVEEAPRSDPPTAPAMGACYIIDGAPTGEWAGKSNYLAGYTSGGWRLIAPIDGLNAYVKSTGTWANYRSGAWEIGTVRGASVVLDGVQVIGPQLGAIPAPTGGTNVDAEARVSISQILAALRQHGLIQT